ncbi:DUF460 domain-containing protein [Candidatus Woesearchaeota archaeon]|nr:DUF460 domain-containing protein [Candidatus Woesearchaeota archaeon]MBW3016039.1 DUF460 domain-containing protein [Candidatus Woesearchaeota archaeon]
MKLIAGIDPGTTVGWAVLNLQGGLVDIGSKKEFDLDSLVAHFVKLGRVLVVGSDKAKVPFFVQDVGVKLGAKVVNPSEDVRVDEKRAMASGFSFGNSHEMDALASALIAFKKVKPLLSRIRSFLAKEKRLGFFEDVVELVLKEGISIRAALVLMTPEEEEKVEEFVEEKRDEDIVHLYSALSRSRKDNAVLLEKNKALTKKLSSMQQELASLKQRVSTLVRPKTHAEIARLKEFQVRSLSNRLSSAVKLQEKLKSQINVLERALFSKDVVPVLRLSKLGWEEVLRFKDFLGSVVFVDDCNEMSGKAVKFLQDKDVQVLVCRKMPSKAAKSHLPFACVPAPVCRIVDHVVLLDRRWLDRVCSERVVLAEIVEEYKKQRSSSA